MNHESCNHPDQDPAAGIPHKFAPHLRFAVVVGMFAIFGAQACNDGAERVAGALSAPLAASAAKNQLERSAQVALIS